MIIPFNSPVSAETAGDCIDDFALPKTAAVLDVGCGSGEFLLRTVEEFDCRGLGVDNDSRIIIKARDNARGRVSPGSVRFLEADVSGLVPGEGDIPGDGFDLAICLGASHAFASGEEAFEAALKGLSTLVKSGGQVFIGEGCWKKDPDPAYLEFLGDPVGIYRSHRENSEFAAGLGFSLENTKVSSIEEWDAFETGYRMRVVAEAADNPGDEAMKARAASISAWWDAYLRWGRETMGFGLYHLRKK